MYFGPLIQISDWLSRAEKIKAYLEVRKLNTLDTSQTEEDENTRLATSSKFIFDYFKTIFVLKAEGSRNGRDYPFSNNCCLCYIRKWVLNVP